MSSSGEDIIGRVDQFIRRGRSFVAGQPAGAPADDGIPLLTDVVARAPVESPEQMQARLREALRDEVFDEVCQSLRQDVQDEVRQALREEVAAEVREVLRLQMHDEIADALLPQLLLQVREELRPQLREEVRIELRDEVQETLREELRQEIRSEIERELLPQFEQDIRARCEAEQRLAVREALDDVPAQAQQQLDAWRLYTFPAILSEALQAAQAQLQTRLDLNIETPLRATLAERLDPLRNEASGRAAPDAENL